MSFELKDRYLKAFVGLKTCVENNNKEDVIDIIPQVTRLYLTDNPNVFDYFNKYDLFIPIMISEEINNKNYISDNVEVTNVIFIKKKRLKTVSHSEFVNTIIGSLSGETFTIKDFLDSIGYHGTLHVKPRAEKKNLKDIYNQLVLPNQDICYKLLFQIGMAYVYAFENVIKEIFITHNLFAVAHDRQPEIHMGEQNQPYLLYDGCYLQGRFDKINTCGMLISFDFEPIIMNLNKHQYVFSLGHTRDKPYSISMYLINDRLICSIYSCAKYYTCQIRLKTRKRYSCSIEIFPDSHAKLKVDGEARMIELERPLGFDDGKIVLGANLYGEKRARFISSYLFLETINEHGVTSQLRTFSLKRENYKSTRISSR